MTDNPTTEPLVYLDVDDEITSVAARIRASDADRVTLVLPFGSRLATSRINFRLLAREATERGKQIEIITADGSARSLAAAAGIPVHPSVAAYEGARAGGADGTPGAATGVGLATGNGPTDDETGSTTGLWTVAAAAATAPGVADVPVGGLDIDDAPTRVITVPRRKSPAVPRVGPPRPPVRTGLAVGIGVAAVAAVVVGALLAMQLLPAATIVLSPRAEAIRPLNLSVTARTDVTAVDAANLLIPAQRIEFDLTASTTVTATGTKVTETKATGNVTFSNFDTGSAIVIPAGSIVQTKGNKKAIQFATIADLTLPRAQIDFFPPFPTRPSTGSVGIEAVKPGESGNVGNNTIVEVPGGDRNLFVTNPEPTAGGSRSEAPEISQDDVDAALEELGDAIQADFDAQVASGIGVPAGVTVFPETAALQSGDFSVDPTTLVGSPELEVQLTETGTGSVIGVDEAPIETIARSRLEAEVDEGWSLDPESVDLTIDPATPFGGGATYPFTIAGTMVRDVDVDALVQSIRGLLVGDARTRLEAYGDVEMSVWPDWVTTIPDNVDRIDLTLGEPALASPAP